MKINNNCLKVVLNYCIDNTDYEEDDEGKWSTKCIGLNTLYGAEELNPYSKKDIMRSVYLLHKCGYIVVRNIDPPCESYYNSCLIEDVTMAGYKFATQLNSNDAT